MVRPIKRPVGWLVCARGMARDRGFSNISWSREVERFWPISDTKVLNIFRESLEATFTTIATLIVSMWICVRCVFYSKNIRRILVNQLAIFIRTSTQTQHWKIEQNFRPTWQHLCDSYILSGTWQLYNRWKRARFRQTIRPFSIAFFRPSDKYRIARN